MRDTTLASQQQADVQALQTQQPAISSIPCGEILSIPSRLQSQGQQGLLGIKDGIDPSQEKQHTDKLQFSSPIVKAEKLEVAADRAPGALCGIPSRLVGRLGPLPSKIKDEERNEPNKNDRPLMTTTSAMPLTSKPAGNNSKHKLRADSAIKFETCKRKQMTLAASDNPTMKKRKAGESIRESRRKDDGSAKPKPNDASKASLEQETTQETTFDPPKSIEEIRQARSSIVRSDVLQSRTYDRTTERKLATPAFGDERSKAVEGNPVEMAEARAAAEQVQTVGRYENETKSGGAGSDPFLAKETELEELDVAIGGTGDDYDVDDDDFEAEMRALEEAL